MSRASALQSPPSDAPAPAIRQRVCRIALPNAASVALHEAIGMRRIGVYEDVGSKSGAWHDVAWYGLGMAEPGLPVAEPVPLPELLSTAV